MEGAWYLGQTVLCNRGRVFKSLTLCILICKMKLLICNHRTVVRLAGLHWEPIHVCALGPGPPVSKCRLGLGSRASWSHSDFCSPVHPPPLASCSPGLEQQPPCFIFLRGTFTLWAWDTLEEEALSFANISFHLNFLHRK